MSEIELITEQIIALEPAIEAWNHQLMIGFLGTMIGFIAGFVMILIDGDQKGGIFMIGFVFFIVAGLSVVLLIDLKMDDPHETEIELEKKRSDTIKSEIKALSCDELRLDILEKLEDDNMEWYLKEHDEFERDLYYHKCEIPLRDEVLKLQ